MTDFHSLGLSKQIVDTLSQNNFATPTPIQAQAIPLVLQGRDLIGLAQTGTGKTAAFGLPIIEMLLKDAKRPDNRTVRTLILAPTRELVNQIADNLRLFVRKSPLRINLVVGGASINKQQLQLERGTDILVATPGRLLDLINRRALSLGHVTHLVLDEADQMLDLGFIHDLRKIAKLVPAKRQTLLFSATMPKAIADLASDYLSNPVKVEVSPPGKAADKVEQYVHFVAGQNHKTEILKETISANPDGRAIVFLRTKHGAEKLMKHLDHVGFAAASIHGNKSQGQRERALKGFRDGEVRVLVATDVAARGIDIPGVSHVYNFDLPEVPDAYVHRIGRTARAGRDGIAIAFCAPDEIRLLRDIERLMGIEIAVASGEAPADRGRPVRGKGRGGQGNGNHGNGGQARGQGQGRGAGQGRSEGRPQRPARRPFFDKENGEVRSENGERQERRSRDDRPQRENNRNADFRGQRRNEPTPRPEPDNDLVSTSDFRPARKQQHNGQANGNGGAHEAGAHRGQRHSHGRPAGRHNEERGAQGEQRNGGNGRMKRRGPGNGGQRRERA